MKKSKLLIVALTLATVLSMSVSAVSAESLDSIVNNGASASTSQKEAPKEPTADQTRPAQETPAPAPIPENQVGVSNDYIDKLMGMDVTKEEVPGIAQINKGIYTVTAFIVQILAYGLTALLSARVLIDIVFIAIPFSRSILSNGYSGNPQAGAGGVPNQQMGGMGGMGAMGGMGGMGGYGGSYGNRYGGGYGGMGGMNRGMGAMGAQAPVQNGALGRIGEIQWVSNAALNAVAAESTVGPDGKSVNAFKPYMKSMIVLLIIVPVLLTLATTGALTDLGFLIGKAVAASVGKLGNML